jgi:uncharacterized heparinase superfamily protein
MYHCVRPLWENPDKFAQKCIPRFPGCSQQLKCNFLPPWPQHNKQSDLLQGQFVFINDRRHLGWPPRWHQENTSKLWQYNLHYFEYLWVLSYEDARKVVLDWIKNYPLINGAVGWEPYPVSIRLLNWSGLFFCKYRINTLADKTFLSELWASLYLQAEWLRSHIENYLLGNHLFENGAALSFIGGCFPADISEKWYKKGKSILAKQIQEQILPDGMHFERSPMYHLRIAYLLAALLNTGRSDLQVLVEKPLRQMLKAIDKLYHPDGRIALLNDSAFGIYNHPIQIIKYASKLLGDDVKISNNTTGGPFALSNAGYYGFHQNDGNYIICDAADIGPNYVPGHAHADMLSFELSLKGYRVIVDSGVYDYDISQMRQYCRSTKAHNTVEINGRDQCEMWSAFRVARRGRPHSVRWLPSGAGFKLMAFHDGYKRLKGSPIHYRQFDWNKSGRLIVKDQVIASCTQSAISRLHLHPDCKIDQLNTESALITYPGGRFKISFEGKGILSTEKSFYCPEFGVKFSNTALAFSMEGAEIETGFRVEAL